jgi:inorganic triphosphatase YgiF
LGAGSDLEIEAKLAVERPDVLEALLRAPELGGLEGFEADGPPRDQTMVDRYVDTAVVGGWLRALGMRARLRETDEGVVLTVKRTGSQAGAVTSRTELEAPATTVLDPHAWPESPARDALFEAIGTDPLLEIARLRQHRLYRVVRRGGTRVELSLDELEAMVGEDVVDRRFEVEAELLEGDPAAVHDLAVALSSLEGVGPPVGSKLQFVLDAMARQAPSALTER